MKVEIWSDVVCPWCYLGKRRFEVALGGFEHRDAVEVVYRSFELDPDAAVGVSVPTLELLAGKYRMTVAQATDVQRQMEETAAGDGLTFHLDGLRSGNTRDAHRLLHLAKDYGLQAELTERLHRAYFSERASVFDMEPLSSLATEVGLDAAEVRAVLTGSRYADAVENDEATAQTLGATGVPFFVVDRRYGIAGAQPAETIAQLLERAWADTAA